MGSWICDKDCDTGAKERSKGLISAGVVVVGQFYVPTKGGKSDSAALRVFQYEGEASKSVE